MSDDDFDTTSLRKRYQDRVDDMLQWVFGAGGGVVSEKPNLFVHDVPPGLEQRLKDFDGTKVDLTDPVMRRFVGNAIAVHVYGALNLDDPAKHAEIHDTVLWVLKNLSTARVKIS